MTPFFPCGYVPRECSRLSPVDFLGLCEAWPAEGMVPYVWDSGGECSSLSGPLLFSSHFSRLYKPQRRRGLVGACRGAVTPREFPSSGSLPRWSPTSRAPLSWVPRCPSATASAISPGPKSRPFCPRNKPGPTWITYLSVGGRGWEHPEA